MSENAERSTPDVAQKSVLFNAEGTATAFTGSAGPPIVSAFTLTEPRGLRSLATRHANGGDQVLTIETYHAVSINEGLGGGEFAAKWLISKGINLF
jgi:hypothetical protein